jgi:hypothetical protein
MKRLLAVMVAVSVLSGCNLQGPPGTDPFFGRTRVPPPGTGSIYPSSTDPYYSGVPYSAVPSSAPRAAVPPVPPGASGQPPASGGGQNYLPPDGSLNYPGSSWTPLGGSATARGESLAENRTGSDRPSDNAGEPPVAPVPRERFVQVLQPRPTTPADSPTIRIPEPARDLTADQPGLFRAGERAVDLSDLRPASPPPSATPGHAAPGEGDVQPVSATGQ